MSEESASDYEYTDNENSLKQFLLTGEIGTLGSQPSMSVVRITLGEPDHVDCMPNVVPDSILKILHYGNLELVYLDDEFLTAEILVQEQEEFDLDTELGIKRYTFLAQMDYRNLKHLSFKTRLSAVK